jgi:hypothetical protein
MKRTLLLLVAAICFSSLHSNAQESKTFSPDSVKFLQELEEVFQKVGGNEARNAKEILSAFSSDWKAGLFTRDQRLSVNQTCSRFLARQLKVDPFYTDYLSTVTMFVRRNLDKKNLSAFDKGVNFYLEEKGTTLLYNYLERCHDLMGSSALFTAHNTAWKCRGANYTFSFDTIPVVIFTSANLVCQLNKDSISIYKTKGRVFNDKMLLPN